MPRYIDAEAMIRKICGMKCGCERYECGYDEAGCPKVRDLETAPTVSPDEVCGVVHCQECDLWNRWDSAGRESLGNLTCSCAHWTVEDGAVIHTKPTDFCSYGERMVSEDA